MNKRNLITIKNGKYEAVIDVLGAQLVSYKVDGVEVMFQGANDEANGVSTQWGKTAPNLFPNPGPMGKTNEKYGDLPEVEFDRNGTKEKQRRYYHNGGLYSLGQHGFARATEFEVRGQTKSSLVLSIMASSETVKEYPYDFTYYVMYELDNNGDLHYTTVAQNNDNKPMLAGMGWHPAFKIHDDPSRYKVVLTNLVKQDDCELSEGQTFNAEDIIEKGKGSVLEGLVEADVVLVYTDKKGKEIPYMTMHTKSPNLVLWSRAKGEDGHENLIAVEPWNCQPRVMQQLTTQDKTPNIKGMPVIAPSEESILETTVRVNPRYTKLFENDSNLSR